jgi:hypothetical protein
MSEINDDNWMEWATADEARAQAEMDARQAAMPLRRMVGIKWSENGKRWEFWELECGHSLPCSVRLDDNAAPVPLCLRRGWSGLRRCWRDKMDKMTQASN